VKQIVSDDLEYWPARSHNGIITANDEGQTPRGLATSSTTDGSVDHVDSHLPGFAREGDTGIGKDGAVDYYDRSPTRRPKQLPDHVANLVIVNDNDEDHITGEPGLAKIWGGFRSCRHQTVRRFGSDVVDD
jgi:hypothetical protein